jgi:membrane protein
MSPETRGGARRSAGGGTATREQLSDEARGPQPQPERHEPRLDDPGLSDLSRRDAVAIGKRAVREALDDNLTTWAGAIAYSLFLALPSTLLLSLGLFSVLAGPDTVATVTEKIGTVVPAEAVTLIEDTLTRIVEAQSGGWAMIAVGGALALWAATSAMTTLMTALNRTYEREETRGFLRQRLTALAMFALSVLAFGLVMGLLVLGPHVSEWVGEAVGLESVVSWLWWAAQWPILLAGLFAVFATILYFGPNVDHPRWTLITPGSVLAVAVWLAASGLFAAYVSMFGSYNKAWGSLGAVIVLLTWLWLSALALLLGAEVNAEVERSRELRAGEPAEAEIQAPPRG